MRPGQSSGLELLPSGLTRVALFQRRSGTVRAVGLSVPLRLLLRDQVLLSLGYLLPWLSDYPSAIPRLSLGYLSAISALAVLGVRLHTPVGGEDARAAVPLQVHATTPTQSQERRRAAREGLLVCLVRAVGVV